MKKLSRKAVTVKAAVVGFLTPRLAQDAKVDLTSIFEGVNSTNYVASKPAIALGVARATAGKLAKDAKLEDLDRVLMTFDAAEAEENDEENDEEKKDAAKDRRGKDAKRGRDAMPESFMKHMEKNMSSDAFKGMCDSMEDYAAEDAAEESAEERKKREDEEAKDKKAADKKAHDEAEAAKKKDAEDNAKAMDSAIRKERENQRATRDAERDIRSKVGDLTIAFDSASDVYAGALKLLGVKTEGIDPSAYKALFDLAPSPISKRHPGPALGMDSSALDAAAKIAPGISRITVG